MYMFLDFIYYSNIILYIYEILNIHDINMQDVYWGKQPTRTTREGKTCRQANSEGSGQSIKDETEGRIG